MSFHPITTAVVLATLSLVACADTSGEVQGVGSSLATAESDGGVVSLPLSPQAEALRSVARKAWITGRCRSQKCDENTAAILNTPRPGTPTPAERTMEDQELEETNDESITDESITDESITDESTR